MTEPDPHAKPPVRRSVCLLAGPAASSEGLAREGPPPVRRGLGAETAPWSQMLRPRPRGLAPPLRSISDA
jgi:hypothetical protein